MATLAGEVLTYADWAKRLDANGRIDTIVEMLRQMNSMLTDMLVVQCNNGTNHKTTVRTGIPEAAWRMLNYGVPRVKTRSAQVQDTTGMLEAYSEVDVDLAKLSGDAAKFRLSEATGIMQGMSNQMATTMFYGNTVANPERFLGLAPRYATRDTAEAQSAENVIHAGGTTASQQTSIWLVTWSQNYTHGLFPQGSKAGLSHNNLGEDTVQDADGGQYQALRDHFKWDLGLTVRDWRYNVRICNVEVPKLSASYDADYLKTLLRYLIEASEKVQDTVEVDGSGAVRKVFYCNKTVRTALRNAILEKVAGNLTWETVEGKRVMMFDEIPVRRSDAILNTEAIIAAP